MKVEVTNAVRVPKGWGYEDIIVNCNEYCGKILHFETGKKFSMHFHKDKKESWYVASGKFHMILIDTTDATRHEWVLEKGQSITITQCLPHQLICLEEGEIYEFSTHHEDCDSYRIERGDVMTGS
jgi:mannose-6-phosphate isomerase-like protein (cupin superfamily)